MCWTDCAEFVSDEFKIDSRSSKYNAIGAVMSKSGNMFKKGVLTSNIQARCGENSQWYFDSTDLHCYRGLFLVVLQVIL